MGRQALLAAIAEECDAAMVSSGPDGLVEVWNRAAEELFGWDAQDAEGASVALLVPPDYQLEAEQLMSQRLGGRSCVPGRDRPGQQGRLPAGGVGEPGAPT